MKSADHKRLESIAEDLFMSFPALIRRLSRDEANLAARTHDPSRMLLGAIAKHGPIPMSVIGVHMGISKPYMTALVNKLIKEGYVERVRDEQDRRVIKVTITNEGREAFNDFMKSTREIVVRNLSTLSAEDISTLQASVKNLRAIASKLEPGEPRR